MAIRTQRDRVIHLLTGEPLFEPLVAMATSGDQMVRGRPSTMGASAQAAHALTTIGGYWGRSIQGFSRSEMGTDFLMNSVMAVTTSRERWTNIGPLI